MNNLHPIFTNITNNILSAHKRLQEIIKEAEDITGKVKERKKAKSTGLGISMIELNKPTQSEPTQLDKKEKK